MILITLGSQKFQFNRILKYVDDLIDDGEIREDVFAQIGYSSYKPKNYKYKEFLSREEFIKLMDSCHKVITHGGTGAIITAIKKNKKVIAIPRLKKYEEHVDDHQLDIVKEFSKMELIQGVNNINELKSKLKKIDDFNFKTYESNTNNVINSIEIFIKNI